VEMRVIVDFSEVNVFKTIIGFDYMLSKSNSNKKDFTDSTEPFKIFDSIGFSGVLPRVFISTHSFFIAIKTVSEVFLIKQLHF